MDIESISHLKSRDKVSVECPYCKSEFPILVKLVRESAKTGKTRYCSTDCMRNAFSEKNLDRVEASCHTCGKTVWKTKSQFKRSDRHFCSQSCAAETNNKLFQKRPANDQIFCSCGAKKSSLGVNQCAKCRKEFEAELILKSLTEKTLAEIKAPYYAQRGKRLGSVSHTIATRVRVAARKLASIQKREKVCKICGYTTYVELCHIHPISSFPDEATLGEINNDKNTVYLCPNHHKEMDLGLLDSQFV